MFSFSSVAVFATLAFSAVSSALPMAAPQVPDLGGVTSIVGGVAGDLPVGGLTSGLPVGGLTSGLPVVGSLRRDAPASIAVVLTTVTTKLGPATDALKFVTAQNATMDACAGPIGEIKDLLTGTVTGLQALVGQPLEVILASVDGTAQVTVAELGVIVGNLVTIVFAALGIVLKTAGGAIDAALKDLLVTVGSVLATVLALVCQLVGGIVGELISVVVPLLGEVVPFILNLNIAEIISLLGLHA